MYRRGAIVVIALVMAIGVYHAFTSYAWSGTLQTPKGAKTASVTYTCGPPWGSSYVHGPATTPYPVQGVPCGQREQYRTMIAIDVVLGLIALAAVTGWHRRVRPQPAVA